MGNVQRDRLQKLFDYLFSVRTFDSAKFNVLVAAHLDALFNDPVAKFELSEKLRSLFLVESLTTAGINSNLGFFPELKQRIKYRILPPVNEDHFFSHFVEDTFRKKDNNEEVLAKFSDENWGKLMQLLGYDDDIVNSLVLQLNNALIILVHQFVTIGIDPYVVKKLPQADDTDSPFFHLNVLVNQYIKKTAVVKEEDIFTSLSRCESVFDYLKQHRETLGISLHLTFLIRRAEQHIARIRLLLQINTCSSAPGRHLYLKELVTSLVRAELHSHSIVYFVGENTGLLANRIANQTSSKGENYIGFTKKENNKLMRSAIGGGCMVVLLVYIKHLIHMLHLPLLPEGILFGLNYGLGFVLMHAMHLTLATKQPAMTASYIAESIEQKGLTKDSRKELSLILAQIMRSQFISLIGNLIAVLPVCCLSAWALLHFFGIHVFSYDEAERHLLSNHPLLSGSLIFAVFTGVFLTLAGLITGYYDNKVVFSNIPKRIINHPRLKRWLKPALLEKFSYSLSKNLGAIAGNLFLGMCLGLAGNLGKFMGLPFDIRHITISAGNFSIAVIESYNFGHLFIATVFAGIIGIGIINIISSFMFSFLIACRSRYLTNRQTWFVFASMVSYIFRNPKILLLRKDAVKLE